MYIYLGVVPVVTLVCFGSTLELGKRTDEHVMDVLASRFPLRTCCVPITFSCLVVSTSKYAIHLSKTTESKLV